MTGGLGLFGKTVSGPLSARVTIDGREYVNFFGTGYLALTGVPEVRAAVLGLLEQGAGFSRSVPPSVGAIDPVFDAVESAAADACGSEASVYFASGYLIGAVGLAELRESFDLLVLDENAHYNLVDATKLTDVPRFTFAYCDADSLRDTLRRHVGPNQRPLVVTDGVFGTDGRVPPLGDYGKVLAQYGGRLLVDESHAFGVVGEHGRGAAEHCGVGHLTTIGTTLGKAICAQGAVVGCSAAGRQRLRFLPPIRGACAGSPLSAAAAAASLKYLSRHPELRLGLRAMADYLRGRLRQIGLEVIESPAPIVSFRLGKREDMLALQQRLFNGGIHLHFSTYLGAGPEGMIRCAVFADHSHQDIDALINALRVAG